MKSQQQGVKKKAILDMDPGIDDAMALLLALNSPDLDILAVTTVSGNVSVRRTTANALRIIEAVNSKVPVHPGASRPIRSGETIDAEFIHGRDGLGDTDLPEPKSAPSTVGAVDAVSALLKAHGPKEISIVATGPLTNVAMLIEKDPSLASRVDRIFVMGGTYDPLVRGNTTEYAEFNFYCDPEAAAIVFDFAAGKVSAPAVVASGLDVTSSADCAVTSTSLSTICSLSSRPAKVACKILQYPVKTYSYFNLHDVFTLFSLLHPEVLKIEECGGISISLDGAFRGRSVVKAGEGGNVAVCRQVNSQRFNQLVVDGLR
ncbi:MAG: nucleoside hydrolase [Nitrososphaera sp.]